MVSHCQRRGGRGGGVLEWSHQQVSTAPTQSFLIGLITQRLCGGLAAAAGLLSLCSHEILMVEQAKERSGEQAGSDPPGEEGEEAPEKQGAKDSPQAPQSH